MLRDLVKSQEVAPGVMVYDFRGPRIDAMNDGVIQHMGSIKSPPPVEGSNTLNRGPREPGFFYLDPLPVEFKMLRERIFACLDNYLNRCMPHLIGLPWKQISWSNWYGPSEGAPWHDHIAVNAAVVAVYTVRDGVRSDFIFKDRAERDMAHLLQTPPGRLVFMSGDIEHCTSPNYGPERRVSIPVDFVFEGYNLGRNEAVQ